MRDGARIAEVDASQSSYTDTTVAVGQKYRYAVEAVDSSGVRSSPSSVARVRTPSRPETPDVTPPTEPEMLEAVRLPDRSVLLDWQYATDDSDVSAFVLRRNGQRVAVLDAATLRYIDTGATRGRVSYSLVAWDVNGLRSRAATVSVDPVGGSAGSSAMPSTTTPAVQGTTQALAAGSINVALRRYPYLTDVVNSSGGTVGYATVNWATDRSATTGSARFGAVAPDGSCDPTTTVTATRTAITINSLPAYQWKALFDLLPGTSYCYRVDLASIDLLGGDPAPQFKTQIPAGSTEPFSFAVFGDWGAVDSASGNPDQANLMAQIAASGVRFAVTTGDNSYPSGSQDNYGDLTNTGPNVSAVFGPQYWTVAGSSIPLFPAVGNHGLSRSDVAHPHLNIWPQDRAVATSGGRYQRDTYCCLLGTQSASLPSAWYAFDAGNVRMYILQAAWADSNTGTASGPYEVDAAYQWTSGSPQYQWLQSDLAAHPGQLKLAVFHYPLYSDQKHENSDTFLQGPASLQGLLNQYGVKMSFNGHAHIYQRNHPDAGDMITYITGAGGAKTQSVGEEPCSAIDAFAIGWSNTNGVGNACGAAAPPSSLSQVFHFLKVTVSGTTVTVTPINSIGQSFDVQTYDFGPVSGDETAPSVPGGVVAVAVSSGRVDLSWSASSDNVGVTGYEVWRNGSLLTTVDGSTLSFSDVGVVPSTSYAYEVRARDAAGNVSAPGVAAPVTTPADTELPSVPGGVVAVAVSSGRVDLSWSASSDNVGVTGYEVWRNGSLLTTVDGSTLSFSDVGVVPSTSYAYEVRARDAAGNVSAPGVAAPVTTPADTELPSVPGGVVAVAVSSGRVDLSWSASSDNVGVTGYEVWRNGSLLTTVDGSTLSFSDVGVVPSTSYAYEVRARDAAGNVSAPGVAAPVTTPGSVTLTLTFVAAADTYVVQSSPGASFGSAVSLLSDTSPLSRIYVRFVVSGVTGSVTGAKVRLRVTDSTSDAPQLFATTTGWSESAMTWNDQPGSVGSLLSDLGSVSKGTWIEYPVTVTVTGDGTFAFVLIPQSSNGMKVSSREAKTNRPQLVITVSP